MNAVAKHVFEDEYTPEPPPTAAEVRKVNQAVRRAVGLALLQQGSSRLAQLDERFMATDRILMRWSASIGSGLPRDDWDDTARARLPPLDDATAIVVDRLVMQAPHVVRSLIRSWYCTPTPVESMARDRAISRATLYLRWRASLEYMRGRSIESRHDPLTRLLSDLPG